MKEELDHIKLSEWKALQVLEGNSHEYLDWKQAIEDEECLKACCELAELVSVLRQEKGIPDLDVEKEWNHFYKNRIK